MKKTKKKKNKFESIKTEELEKKLKTTKSLHIIMISILALIVILYTYLVITEGSEINTSTIFITICVIGGIIFNNDELKAIKNELNTRKNKHSS